MLSFYNNINKETMSIFRVGSKVKIVSDNENYADYIDKTLVVTYSAVGGLGYDDCMHPQKLMDFKTLEGEDFPFALYEYEVEKI